MRKHTHTHTHITYNHRHHHHHAALSLSLSLYRPPLSLALPLSVSRSLGRTLRYPILADVRNSHDVALLEGMAIFGPWLVRKQSNSLAVLKCRTQSAGLTGRAVRVYHYKLIMNVAP